MPLVPAIVHSEWPFGAFWAIPAFLSTNLCFAGGIRISRTYLSNGSVWRRYSIYDSTFLSSAVSEFVAIPELDLQRLLRWGKNFCFRMGNSRFCRQKSRPRSIRKMKGQTKKILTKTKSQSQCPDESHTPQFSAHKFQVTINTVQFLKRARSFVTLSFQTAVCILPDTYVHMLRDKGPIP